MDHIHIADLTFHVFGDHVCKQYLVYLRRNRVQWWVECRSAVVRPLFLLAIPIPQALKGPTTLHPSRFVRRLLSFARSGCRHRRRQRCLRETQVTWGKGSCLRSDDKKSRFPGLMARFEITLNTSIVISLGATKDQTHSSGIPASHRSVTRGQRQRCPRRSKRR